MSRRSGRLPPAGNPPVTTGRPVVTLFGFLSSSFEPFYCPSRLLRIGDAAALVLASAGQPSGLSKSPQRIGDFQCGSLSQSPSRSAPCPPPPLPNPSKNNRPA